MANIPSMNRHVVNVVKDVHGEPILDITMTEADVFHPDGSVTKCRVGESIQLVCGSVYNPAQSTGQSPVMLLGVCESCRHPRFSLFSREMPTHGLCSKSAGRTCDGCGAFLCPAHALAGADGRHRCRSCHRKHVASSWLTAIFFKEEN